MTQLLVIMRHYNVLGKHSLAKNRKSITYQTMILKNHVVSEHLPVIQSKNIMKKIIDICQK